MSWDLKSLAGGTVHLLPLVRVCSVATMLFVTAVTLMLPAVAKTSSTKIALVVGQSTSKDSKIEQLLLESFNEIRKENYDKAIEKANQVLKKDPHQSAALSYKVFALEQDGQWKEALRLLKPVFDERRQTAFDWTNLGDLYFAVKRPESALSCYRHAIKMAPNFMLPKLRVVKTLSHQGKFEDAKIACREYYVSAGNAAERQAINGLYVGIQDALESRARANVERVEVPETVDFRKI